MSRSQDRKRVIYGRDSRDYTDITSSYGPRPTTNALPAAPTGTLGGSNTLTAAALPTFVGSAQGGTITVTRQWLRGESRIPIAGATAATYVQSNALVAGQRIRVRYIAKNNLGEWWVDSSPTGVVP